VTTGAGSGRAPAATAGPLPAGAFAAGLASLPGVGPGWLFEMLSSRAPQEVWELVSKGVVVRPTRARPRPEGPLHGPGCGHAPHQTWAELAQRLDLEALWGRLRRHGIAVTFPGAAGFPSRLLDGPAPAGVLFALGDLAVVERRPCVAVVGTRRCSPEGRAVAYELGYDLARAGVCVVSGLALGVDGAAHAGAVAAQADMAAAAAHRAGADVPRGTTAGVAASGVDVVYPRQHIALWRAVARVGVVLSETPPGMPAQSWRFPSRNRVIAGLADMVVVVECHAAGGSWHTVEAALRRGTEVGAVPGPVRSSASVGTNTLLHEGATPIRGAADVLDALGLLGGAGRVPRAGCAARAGHAGAGPVAQGRATLPAPGVPPALRHRGGGPVERSRPGEEVDPLGTQVLSAVGWSPTCLDEVVERSGLPLAVVVLVLDRLESAGAVLAEAGWWWRRPR